MAGFFCAKGIFFLTRKFGCYFLTEPDFLGLIFLKVNIVE